MGANVVCCPADGDIRKNGSQAGGVDSKKPSNAQRYVTARMGTVRKVLDGLSEVDKEFSEMVAELGLNLNQIVATINKHENDIVDDARSAF